MQIKVYWESVECSVKKVTSLQELINKKRRFSSGSKKLSAKVENGVLVERVYCSKEK